jgi:hypothetical protein
MKNELLHNLGKSTEPITPHGEVVVKSPKQKEYKLTYLSNTSSPGPSEIIFIDYGDGSDIVGMRYGSGSKTQGSKEYARDTWNECIKKGYKVVK